jgi:hypothetical protein
MLSVPLPLSNNGLKQPARPAVVNIAPAVGGRAAA